MQTQLDVESIVHRLYKKIGGNPLDLRLIKPIDGGWDNALSYEITRFDLKHTRVYRSDLDDQNEQKIETSLRNFI
jgi:hypothetical protein